MPIAACSELHGRIGPRTGFDDPLLRSNFRIFMRFTPITRRRLPFNSGKYTTDHFREERKSWSWNGRLNMRSALRLPTHRLT